MFKQGRPISVAATTLAQIAKAETTKEEPWRKGRGGTSIGRAVHAVLQTIDLASGSGLEATARTQASAEGIRHRESEVLELSRVALGSEVVKRAVASGKFWREVPPRNPLRIANRSKRDSGWRLVVRGGSSRNLSNSSAIGGFLRTGGIPL